jgi:acyl-homoserine lactone acylase PvdQ
MGLMGSFGVNNTPPPVTSSQAKEAAADAKETAQGMRDIMNSMKELSQELRNQQMQKITTKEENSKLEQKTDRALDQLKENDQKLQQQVQSQQQTNQSFLGNDMPDVIASFVSALIQEDELDETSSEKKALEEKLDELLAQAEGLSNVELSNSDQNYELGKMAETIEKLLKLKKRNAQLKKQIEDLEINEKNRAER